MEPQIIPADAPRPDVDRLVELVAVVQATQRAEDAEGFIALFDPDAHWVSAGGVRLVGLEAIADFTRRVLPGGMTGLSVRYDVSRIHFVTPDVAVTSIEQEYLSPDGSPLEPRQLGRPTYVWRRSGEDWLVVTGQNTGVPLEPVDGPVPVTDEDAAAIGRVVAGVELGFNTNDPDLLVADVADDALVVNAMGAVLRGREEIDRVTRASLDSPYLRDATAHYRLSDLALLAPDVAVAHKSAWSTAAAADAGDGPEMNALYVLVRRDDRWWVVRRQNTLVVPV